MRSLFNYSTLRVDLDRTTKTLNIFIDRRDEDNCINGELLFELETMLNWVSNHLEISSILFSSTTDHFGRGFDKESLLRSDTKKLKMFLERLQKITHSLCYLPQTVVFDLRNGCESISSELALAADIRLATKNTVISYNHLQHGMMPCCGGIGLLEKIVGNSHARNWVLSGDEIPVEQLMASGFIHKFYDEVGSLQHAQTLMDCLKKIDQQGPVQRMQSKRAFLDGLLPVVGRIEKENAVTFGGLITNDWKEALKANKDGRPPKFTSAQELVQMIKSRETGPQNMA